MTRRTRRSIGAVSGLLAAIAVIAVGAATVGAKPAGKADSGTVYFAVTHTANGKEYAAGNSTDKLLGTGAVTYVITIGPSTAGTYKITSKPVTLYASTGTLTGTATATLTIGAKGAATITSGKLTAAGGTGGQKGHSVKDTFTGTGNATTALYKVVYKGTYK